MNLNQITIAVTDVERSIDFYRRLGLRLIVGAVPRYARFESPEGDATFSVHKVDRMPGELTTVIYFEVEDVDATVDKLMANGVQFDQAPEDQSWLWREARLRDPDGNPLIIYHAGHNRKNPPWRIE